MMSSEELAKECKETYVSLEKIANNLALLYSICIWLAIIVNIILIGNIIKNQLINYIVGAFGLLFTLVPLILKNKIEKIEGYINLSIDFKNLEHDFKNNTNTSNSHKKLQKLRKNLSKYPIKFPKWLP